MRNLLFLLVAFIFSCCSQTASKSKDVAHESAINQIDIESIMNAIVWSTEEPSAVYDNYIKEIGESESADLISKYGKYVHVVREAIKGDEEAIKIVRLIQKRSDASAHELNSGILQVVEENQNRRKLSKLR